MIEREHGRIVNIASMAGVTGEAFTSPYCASKFGVIGFTQSMAFEVGKYGITANVVNPGPTKGPLIDRTPKMRPRKNSIPRVNLALLLDAGIAGRLMSR